MRNRLLMYWRLIAVLATLGLSGCGNGKFPVRPASGKVVVDGQPVTSGSVTFTPIGRQGELESGKAATGAIGPDGTFKLSTFDRFDGAIVGKHRVEYTGNEGDDAEGSEDADGDVSTNKPPAKSKDSTIGQGDELIVEVASSGSNVFTIELTKRKNRPSRDGS